MGTGRRGTRRCISALSLKNRLVPGCRGFVMRFTGNFYSEWANARGNHSLLVALVACAVGATAGGAVMLSLVGSPATQSGVSSISPRPIVRNAGTSEANKTVQDQPTVETPPRSAAIDMASGRDKSATQPEADPQAEVHNHESQKHGRVVSHEPHWRRPFAHAFSPLPRFSSW